MVSCFGGSLREQTGPDGFDPPSIGSKKGAMQELTAEEVRLLQPKE
jgi:hypothetical protein